MTTKSPPSTTDLHPRTRVEGDLAYITLTKGYTAVIDAADAELVGRYAWCALVQSHGAYAYRTDCSGDKPEAVYLHRLLMDAPADLYVDHIDGDRLNNRRDNLRLATHAENMRNMKRPRTNTSGFKGVYWSRQHSKWRARIMHNGKQHCLGLFDCPQEAHAAYCKAAEELHGEFARAA